ncbi:MAG: hypothetical protein HY965_01385 [Ignavibacteriales bacterium]|nr:hypothetical protein [Ignavibacteriales bacterium]
MSPRRQKLAGKNEEVKPGFHIEQLNAARRILAVRQQLAAKKQKYSRMGLV